MVGLVFGPASGLALGLVGWLVFGLVVGLAVELGDPARELAAWLAFGLVFGFVFGLVVGLATWVRLPGSNDRSRTPASSYRDSRNLTVLSGLVFGPVVGLVFGLAAGLMLELVFGVASELALQLRVGLVFGVAVGLALAPLLEAGWFGFVLTSWWLAFRGKLPWRLMALLDDAHRLGLLRTAGVVYQFRHAELQDHLASSENAAPDQPK